jgi:hypothetical protein
LKPVAVKEKTREQAGETVTAVPGLKEKRQR